MGYRVTELEVTDAPSPAAPLCVLAEEEATDLNDLRDGDYGRTPR